MLTVSHDLGAVESLLVAGSFSCPQCRGFLRPWGFGRLRIIRSGVPVVKDRVRPRRGRCGQCGVTHILLPVVFAARRADAVLVIAHAVECSVIGGVGYRTIASELGRPVSTVRGWIRDFQVIAPAMLAEFTQRVHRATADALEVWPAMASSVVGNALGMVMAHAQMLAGCEVVAAGAVVMVTWHSGGLAGVGPWFFSKVGWPDGVQHQLALPVGG